MNYRDAECERLMKELLQLEQESRALDLRDKVAWEAHQQKIKIMRERIGTFGRSRQHRGAR
jgi:hypothetical protein